MTKEQKHQIYVLRLDGSSYGEISKRLDMNIDSVKNYCQKCRINGQKQMLELNAKVIQENQNICQYCLEPIEKSKPGRTKKFCSEECRRKWWKEHPENINKKDTALYHYTCPTCGKDFTAYGNSKRTYCSHSCYIEHRFGKIEPATDENGWNIIGEASHGV